MYAKNDSRPPGLSRPWVHTALYLLAWNQSPRCFSWALYFPSILRTLGKGILMSPRFPRERLCVWGLSNGSALTTPKKTWPSPGANVFSGLNGDSFLLLWPGGKTERRGLLFFPYPPQFILSSLEGIQNQFTHSACTESPFCARTCKPGVGNTMENETVMV